MLTTPTAPTPRRTRHRPLPCGCTASRSCAARSQRRSGRPGRCCPSSSRSPRSTSRPRLPCAALAAATAPMPPPLQPPMQPPLQPPERPWARRARLRWLLLRWLLRHRRRINLLRSRPSHSPPPRRSRRSGPRDSALSSKQVRPTAAGCSSTGRACDDYFFIWF
jgi:hypothetical protein